MDIFDFILEVIKEIQKDLEDGRNVSIATKGIADAASSANDDNTAILSEISESATEVTSGLTTLISLINTVKSKNPLALLGTEALIFSFYRKKYWDTKAEMILQENQPDEQAQVIMNLTSAFNEDTRAATKKMQETANNAASAKDDWEEIKTMVNTEDGSIINQESIGKLQTLISSLNIYLNGAAKIEIDDNKIQDYKYFSDHMTDIIDKTRIESQKEYLSEVTNKAYGNINWIKEQLEVTGKNLNDEANNYNNYLNLLEAAKDAHSYTKDDFTKREIAIEEAKENVAQLSALYYALRELEKAYQAPIDKYDSLLDEEKKYEIEPLEKERSTTTQYDSPDITDKNPATLDNFINGMGNIMEFLTDTVVNNIAATVQAVNSASTPAAAYVSPTENSSSESQSGCCCKIDVDRILEGLNKPISITLNEEVVGEAVLTYANNKSHMTGN